jgi:hypothetical protein
MFWILPERKEKKKGSMSDCGSISVVTQNSWRRTQTCTHTHEVRI